MRLWAGFLGFLEYWGRLVIGTLGSTDLRLLCTLRTKLAPMPAALPAVNPVIVSLYSFFSNVCVRACAVMSAALSRSVAFRPFRGTIVGQCRGSRMALYMGGVWKMQVFQLYSLNRSFLLLLGPV